MVTASSRNCSWPAPPHTIRRRPSGEWHPLGLLLLSVGSDPLASLALGFGTAVLEEESDLYMVTVKHTIGVLGRTFTVQLADVVSLNTQLPAPGPPTDLGARLLSHTRPQTTDAPALDSVAIDWRRPLNPVFAHLGDDAPYAIAYAIGRFDSLRGEILLTRRPSGVDGWKPFVAGQPNAAAPVTFVDHHERNDDLRPARSPPTHSARTTSMRSRLRTSSAAGAGGRPRRTPTRASRPGPPRSSRPRSTRPGG